MTPKNTDAEASERCDWCNTPLWGHEEEFGDLCMSCQQQRREMNL